MNQDQDSTNVSYPSKRFKRDHDSTKCFSNQSNQTVLFNELILFQIFHHLPTTDVFLLGRVCRFFRSLSIQCVNHRRALNHIFQPFYPFSAVSKGQQRAKKGLVKGELISGIKSLRNFLDNNLHRSFCGRPCLALLMHGNIGNRPTWEKLQKGIGEFVDGLLPSDCISLKVYSRVAVNGIVDRKLWRSSKAFGALSYLFVPENNSQYKIATFVNDGCLAKYRDDLESIKCILVFKTNADLPLSELNSFVQKSNYTIPIGGIVANDVRFKNASKEETTFEAKKKDYCGLIFFGPGVQASSVVISSLCQSEILEKLIQFKQNLPFDPYDKKHDTVCIMNGCISRLPANGNDNSIDEITFSQVFPNVCVIGMYGFGEIGFDYSTKPFDSTKKVNLINYNSVVFTMIQFVK